MSIVSTHAFHVSYCSFLKAHCCFLILIAYLLDNGRAYWYANAVALAEGVISWYFLPQYKAFPYVTFIGTSPYPVTFFSTYISWYRDIRRAMRAVLAVGSYDTCIEQLFAYNRDE